MVSVILAIGYGIVKIPIFVGRGAMKFLMVLFAVIANTFLALPAMSTAVRRGDTAVNGEFSIWKLGTFIGPIVIVAVGVLLTVAILAGGDSGSGKVHLTRIIPTISQHVPFGGYILIGLATTNLLSLCYELGRNKVTKNDEVKAEPKDEKPDDGVSDFLTMYDSIRGFDSLAPEQTRELYRRIVELTGERKITPDEAKKLCALVENGEKNHIEQ